MKFAPLILLGLIITGAFLFLELVYSTLGERAVLYLTGVVVLPDGAVFPAALCPPLGLFLFYVFVRICDYFEWDLS